MSRVPAVMPSTRRSSAPASDSIKVLFVTEDLGGGTGAHLVKMLGRWDSAMVRAELLCFGRRYNVPLPEYPVEFVPAGGLWHHFPLAQLRALWRVRRAVRRFVPDVVHTYFFWPVVYGRILKRLGAIEHLVENREDLGFSWGRAEYRLLRATRHVPDRVVCVADAVRRVVEEREGLSPERALTIRNGVETVAPGGSAAGVRQELGFGSEELIVGMVSNLNRRIKGVEYFIEAAPAIREQVPSARFLILGGGRYREEFERLAEDRGVSAWMRFAGHQQEISRYYDAMDISVLTSLSEGLSITLLESLGHGLPVVATDVGGNREVVVDGVTGFLVPPKDVPSFVERVVRLLRDRELRRAMGRAGRERCVADFDIGRVGARYQDLYRSLLDPPANPRGMAGRAAASA